jgi:hypothetical protein
MMKNILNRFLFTFLATTFLIGCNVAEQEALNDEALEAATGVSSNTFNYNATTLTLTENTTNVSVFPIGVFSGTSFSINPTLPSGLALRITTGELTGVPTQTITSTQYTVRAVKGAEIKTSTITISIGEEPPKTINYPYTTLNFLQNSNTATFIPTTSGGAITNISIKDPAINLLPTGLTINSTTGLISGTPLVATLGTYTIIASNPAGSTSTSVFINVVPQAPTGLTYTNSPQDNIFATSAGLTAITPMESSLNLDTSLYYTISPGLPPGLSISPTTGEISGSPTSSNSITSYVVSAKNSSGTTTANISLNVQYPPESVTYNGIDTLPLVAQMGVQILPLVLNTYLGGKPVTYSCPACTTAGLTIDTLTGRISGAPTSTGIFNLIVTASHDTTDLAATATTRTVTSSTMTLNVSEDYPENGTLGYQSSYSIYKDITIPSNSIISNPVNGAPSSYIISMGTADLTAIGLSFNATTGEISGTSIAEPVDLDLTITGYNTDHLLNPLGVITTQTVSIGLKVLPPTMIGYDTSGGTPYNSGVYEFVDGVSASIKNCFELTPGTCTGGVPDSYHITPKLPNGLSFNTTTGEVSGSPFEISPAKYYTVRATNSAGDYLETISISTNTLIAPQSLAYNDSDCNVAPVGDNVLNMILASYTAETPCYSGSQGIYTISPGLPTGLSIHSNTGIISGIPLVSNNTGLNDTFTISITNSLGAISIAITINIADLKIPSNLVYSDINAATTIELVEGDTLSDSNILHSSDYDSNQINGGYISDYPLTAAGFVLAGSTYTNGTMLFDKLTGAFSGVAQATDPGDLTPAGISMSILPSNKSGNAAAPTTFNLTVNEIPPNVTFNDIGYGENIIFVEGGSSQTFSVTNTGGNPATINAGTGGCTLTESSFKDQANHYVLGNNVLSANELMFDPDTCTVTYTYTAQCFNDDPDGNGFSGDSIIFDVLAKNSGNPTGVTTKLTAHFYDKPSFTFTPDAEFPNEKLLVLDGGQVSDSYAPTQNACHEGDFTLTTATNLPIPFTFNTSTGAIQSNQISMLGRVSFTLSATELSTGFGFNQTEAIEVQANYIEVQAGVANERFDSQRFDLNQDGLEDIILRSNKCDGEGCTTEIANTVLLVQDSVTKGLFYGTGASLPVLTNIRAKEVVGVKYDTGKAGIIYISEDGSSLTAQSTTAVESDTVAVTETDNTAGAQGLVSGEADTTVNFAHFQTDEANDAIRVSEYAVTGNNFSTIAIGATRLVNPAATGGADVNFITLVRHNNTDGGVNNSAFISYREQTSGETKICILPFDGTNFAVTCSGTITLPNPTNDSVREMKFADIDGDGLDELFLLISKTDNTNAEILIYENQTDTLPGLYSLLNTIDLGSRWIYFDFDIGDTNNDGNLDIIVNNIYGDINNDGTPDVQLNGATIYYHTGNTITPYLANLTSLLDHSFYYSKSAGHTNQVELIPNGTDLLLFHCQFDDEIVNTAGSNSGCGVL